MITFIKKLFGFGIEPIQVEEVSAVKAPARQRAGTVAEVKLSPLTIPQAKAKARKPYYGKKKPTAKPTAAKAPVKAK